jgi:hypothetical protein
MDVSVVNKSHGNVKPVTISPFPPEMELFSANDVSSGNSQYARATKTFAAGTENITLEAGQSVRYSLTWDQKDDYGQQAPPGAYFYKYTCWLDVPIIGRAGSGGRLEAFTIQHSPEPLLKTIDLNQCRNVRNLTFRTNGIRQHDVDPPTYNVDLILCLRHVESNKNGTTFVMMASSPNNPQPNYMGWSSGSDDAYYLVDGVRNYAGQPNRLDLGEGLQLTWSSNGSYYIAPLPSDAQRITFILNDFNGWKGPWEFQVPLK